jgi:hypothetical protein
MDRHLIDRLSRSLASGSSRRQLFKVVGGGAAASALAVAGLQETEAARNPFKNIRVTGRRGGRQVFAGLLNVNRFVVDGGKLFAVGTLRGELRRGVRTLDVGPRRVRVPVTRINGRSLAGLSASDVSAQRVCNILTLTLGPLDLNLLGLRVELNQVVLKITAITGSLLGDLLCAVANLLSGGLLGNLLTQLAGLLNRILNRLG